MLGLERKIETAARKGAAFSAAFVFGLIGGGFLTAAAWMLLAELKTELFAATVIGAVYLGIAAVLVAVGLKKPTPVVEQVKQAEMSPLQLVVVSFIQGFEQSRRR